MTMNELRKKSNETSTLRIQTTPILGVVISHTQDNVFMRAYLLDSTFGFCNCRIKMCILVFLIAIHAQWEISGHTYVYDE